LKRTTTERRAETAARLTEAETQAEAAQKRRLALALNGEDTSVAEESAWKADARIRTLREAVASLDAQIAVENAAAAEAEAERRRAEAQKKVAAMVEEIEAIAEELFPRVERAFQLARVGDSVLQMSLSSEIGPMLGSLRALPRLAGYLRGASLDRATVERVLA
jgi:uncharacterized protein YhaN